MMVCHLNNVYLLFTTKSLTSKISISVNDTILATMYVIMHLRVFKKYFIAYVSNSQSLVINLSPTL